MGSRKKCVYCLKQIPKGVRSKDHIPPKVLWANKLPNCQLITVPSCKNCNSGDSLDDEYMFVMMAGSQHINDEKYKYTIKKSTDILLNKNKKKMLDRFMSSFKSLPEPFNFLAQGMPAYDVDLNRLCKVISRTVVGLIYHHFNTFVSQSHQIQTFSTEGIKMTPDLNNFIKKTLVPIVIESPKYKFDERFIYSIGHKEGYWVITILIYEAYQFYSFITPKKKTKQD